MMPDKRSNYLLNVVEHRNVEALYVITCIQETFLWEFLWTLISQKITVTLFSTSHFTFNEPLEYHYILLLWNILNGFLPVQKTSFKELELHICTIRINERFGNLVHFNIIFKLSKTLEHPQTFFFSHGRHYHYTTVDFYTS